WNLVRTGNRSADKENWLLIKSHDKYASETGTGADLIETLPNSVQSGRDLDEIASNKPPRPSKPANQRTRVRHGEARSQRHGTTSLPETLRPQLATLVERPPS